MIAPDNLKGGVVMIHNKVLVGSGCGGLGNVGADAVWLDPGCVFLMQVVWQARVRIGDKDVPCHIRQVEGVGVDVAGNMEEGGVCVYERGFVSTLKEVPDAVVACVAIQRKRRHGAAHEFCHAVDGMLFQEEVKVIWHEAESQKINFFFEIGKRSGSDNRDAINPCERVGLPERRHR